MSKTMSVGVFGVDHWAYLSERLVLALKKILSDGCIVKDSVLPGVLIDAVEFFEPIFDFRHDGSVSENPEATAHVAVLYGSIIRTLLGDQKLRSAEIMAKLKEVGVFILSLEKPRRMNPKEYEIARFALVFFGIVWTKGESHGYSKVMEGREEDDSD